MYSKIFVGDQMIGRVTTGVPKFNDRQFLGMFRVLNAQEPLGRFLPDFGI